MAERTTLVLGGTGKTGRRVAAGLVSVNGVHAFVRHRSLLRRQRGPNIPEAQEVHITTLHAETKLPQRRHDHVKITTRVMAKPRDEGVPRVGAASKIDGEQAARRLENAADLVQTSPAGIIGQVMPHHRTQYDVELGIRPRERLDRGDPKVDLRARHERLLSAPADHRRRGINPGDLSRGPHALLGHNRERSRPASHVEHRLARCKAGQVRDSIAKRTLLADEQHSEQQVIEERPVDESSLRARRRLRLRATARRGDRYATAP
jgi:hypothetical protein